MKERLHNRHLPQLDATGNELAKQIAGDAAMEVHKETRRAVHFAIDQLDQRLRTFL